MLSINEESDWRLKTFHGHTGLKVIHNNFPNLTSHDSNNSEY